MWESCSRQRGAEIAMLNTGIGYTAELTDHVIQAAADSQIVQEQLKQKTINVFTGEEFGAESEESRFDMSHPVYPWMRRLWQRPFRWMRASSRWICPA